MELTVIFYHWQIDSALRKCIISFVKLFLELKKTSCNIAAKSELGRFPLDSFIKTQVLLKFCRINCHEINPLVKEAFAVNKSMSEDGIYTWYTFAKHIFKEFNIDEEEYMLILINLLN